MLHSRNSLKRFGGGANKPLRHFYYEFFLVVPCFPLADYYGFTEIRPESGRLIPLCNLAGAEGAKTAKPYLLSLRHRLHQLSYFLGFRLVPLH